MKTTPKRLHWRSFVAATLSAAALAGCHKVGTSETANGTVAPAATPAAAPGAAVDRDSITDLADRGRILGSADAPVWIVEASDFQCPFCKAFHDQTFPQVIRDYVNTNKVRVAFLNFPLSMHRNSHQAAEAGMCASVQQHFWPMHDALFATQDRWGELPDPTAVYDSLARAIGLNEPDWKRCFTTHATLALVQADYARAQQSGVQSTPTFFIGSSVIEGAQPYQEFRDTIESVLKRTKPGAPPARQRQR